MIPLQLHEAIEDAEDQRRQLSAAKKKSQRLAAEMQDTKLHLEEQMSRNNDLERKQRRWASTNFVNTLSLYSIDTHFFSQQFLKIWPKMVSIQYWPYIWSRTVFENSKKKIVNNVFCSLLIKLICFQIMLQL